jgi:hypothetical protein
VGVGSAVHLAVADGCLHAGISLGNLQVYLIPKIVGDCIDYQVLHMKAVLFG